ncbi:MAG: phosphoglucomutase/phosphomannomutase family protein [Desulfuromonadaceae bacterium]|nr:phosphoglucomutase/phosphomannomutase family protein [Desulfuromonadaceae bacterium]MDD2855539.1 phosphoglucomutase/phosphomannomutase family protein [Desulfuromonadaceae bacterium]
MQIKFGTDGWRGVIAKEFTFENLSRVAQATMDYLNREGLGNRGIVIGHDRRFLSRDFAKRVAEIAAGNDIHVRLTEDYAPTPAVSWAVRETGSGAGIMITASHNPPEYNGFKIKESFGGSALPVTTKIIEEIVAYNLVNERRVLALSYSEALNKGYIELFDPSEGYFHQLSRYVDLELIKKSGVKVVVDSMYGAGCGYISRLLPDVKEIHNIENPSFGGRPPEPISQNLAELSALLKTGEYGVGLALDGDADRIGAVDENGDFFSSHYIFTVILRHLIDHKKLTGAVVKTVSTTRMIDLLADKFGLELLETPIGFKHICELMLEQDVLMGGEESGGLGVKGHLPERDGILLGLLLMEVIAANGKGLRQLLDETMNDIGHFFYQRIDRHIDDADKERLIEKLRSHPPTEIDGHQVVSTNFSDGFKFIFKNGDWLLIRPSGTEPLLRLYSEAGSLQQVESFLRKGLLIAGC